MSIGKIAGAILLLCRKAVGRTLLKVCTIISLVFTVLVGAVLLLGLALLSSALPAVVILITLLVLGCCGAYYWFILSTLARDDVIGVLE